MVVIAETFKRQGFLFILLTLCCAYMLHELHFRVTDSWLRCKILVSVQVWSCCVQEIRVSLSSAGLVQKFQAYLFYLSLIRNKNPRPFSLFQKFLHFTYMLLWFRVIIPSFPAQIDDMGYRFSALFIANCSGWVATSGGSGDSARTIAWMFAYVVSS